MSEEPVPSSERPFSGRGRIVGEAIACVVALGLAAWAVRANDVWLERHMTVMYCVSDVGQLAKLHVLRGVALVVALVCVVSLRPRLGDLLGRWAGRRSGREMGTMLGSIALALVLAVVVSDAYLRWKRARIVAAPGEPFNRGIPAPLDARGLRLLHGEPLDPERDTLVVNGESVAFGWGLADDDTIGHRLGVRLGMQTRTIALPGSANDEQLMRLRDELPRTPKPRVVVTFVLLNWLYRNIGNHRDHLVIGGDGRLRVAPGLPSWLWTSPLFEMARGIYHEADPVELVRVIVKETAELVRSVSAYPLFVGTQCGVECIANGPAGPRNWQRILEGQDVDAILVPQPATHLPNDLHPDRAGAEQYAVAIETALRAKGFGAAK